MATAAVLCGAVLAACSSPGDKADPEPDTTTSASAPISTAPKAPTATSTPAAPATTAPLGDHSFAKGSCVADGPSGSASENTAFLAVVPCTAPEAFARVVKREPFDVTKITNCSDGAEDADRIVQLSRPGSGKTAGKTEYAAVCLRNLTAPHPGDPGQGGGPDIVKGDCLKDRKSYQLPVNGTGSGTTTVEMACSGTGLDQPDYRVIGLGTTTIVKGQKGTPCPPATQVTFTAQDERFIGAVYCAVRM